MPNKNNANGPGIINYLSERLLRNENDKPFFQFLIKSSCILFSAISLYVFPSYALYILPAHLAIYMYYIGPFITMYHDLNHSSLFKNQKVNKFLIDLSGLLYGITPEVYFSHHIIMHHPENNMHNDLNSTLPYQRDSWGDFLKYYFKFFFSLFELPGYLLKSGNKSKMRYARHIIYSEITLFIITLILLKLRPVATLGVVIIPVLVTRTLLIIGNWGEHAFIDPNDPGNLFRNSTNIIGGYNRNYFNVGYHIGHHIKPKLHYSLLEKDFFENIEKYSKEDAIVFKDLHYPHIWFYLITKNYKALTDRFISLPGRQPRSETEVMNLLKSRLVPIR